MTTVTASTTANPPRICPWLDDRRWVYSITFDEALADLHRFAVPILSRLGVPGHLEVVVGQMGQVRQIGASSYNGFRHMGGEELRAMLAMGWGVGNHSWTHDEIDATTTELELGKAKETLEAAIGQSISIFCSPGNNANMNDAVLAACRRYGYLAAMSITDALNRPGDADLLWLNRSFLHTQGYTPFFSEFDPFRNIAHARREQGWIIDYCHCPLEQAVHVNKDCSAAQLQERVETVCSEGGSDVWLANVDDVVDYRYTRRAAVITAGGDGQWRVSAPGLHASVRNKVVTLTLPAGTVAAKVDGKAALLQMKGGRILLNVDLGQPRTLTLGGARQLDLVEERRHG